MREAWQDMGLIMTYKDLHEGVLYWMEEDDIELMFQRSIHQKDKEVTKELKRRQEEQSQFDDNLWQQVEEGYGSLVENKDYIEAWHDKDYDQKRQTSTQAWYRNPTPTTRSRYYRK
eukprot:6490255-Amphidinium_carterae.5